MRYLLKLLGVGVLGFVGLVLALIAVSWARYKLETPEEKAARGAQQEAERAEKMAQAVEKRAQAASSDPAEPKPMTAEEIQQAVLGVKLRCIAAGQDNYKGVDWNHFQALDSKLEGETLVLQVDDGRRDGKVYRLICKRPLYSDASVVESELLEVVKGKAKKATPPPDCAKGFPSGEKNRGKCRT